MDRVNVVNALKVRAGRSSRAATRISLERTVHNLAIGQFQSNSSAR
jgi:hypothetical protein